MNTKGFSSAAVVLFVFGAPCVRCQTIPPDLSPTVAALAHAVQVGDSESVGRFWASTRGAHSPLVEAIPGDTGHVFATFLWRGDSAVKDVVLMAQPDGVVMFRDSRSHLARLAGTDVWYRTHRLPIDAEFSYAFSINPPPVPAGGALSATIRSDPLNPLQSRILAGPVRSIARMPQAKPEPWIEDRHVPRGQLSERFVPSPMLTTGSTRHVWVYMPPGITKDPNLLILLDGATYVKAMPTTRMLDNLLAARRIPPTVVAFVADADGDGWRTDLYFSDAFVAFLSNGLVSWLEREYGFRAVAARTGIGGESIAGLTAAFAALRRPDVFSKVLVQSASFWLNNRESDNGEPEWLSRQFLRAPAAKLSFWIDVGTMEFVANEADRVFPPFVPGMTSLLAANRHLRDVLRVRCYDVQYHETNGGHEPLRWTRTLPEGLLALFGRGDTIPGKIVSSAGSPCS
jgi:enterochelin esterase family protein